VIVDRKMKRPPKTAVFGAEGFLGSRLLRNYRTIYPDAVGTTRRHTPGIRYFDLKNPSIMDFGLAESGHSDAVIAAGITGVAQCERGRKESWACNVDGTLDLARQLSKEGLKVIWFSSDYVFDGKTGKYTEHSETHPLNTYGEQKEFVEKHLPGVCGDNYLILRIGKLFSINGEDRSLLNEMADDLSQGKAVRAARDQMFCPTLVDDLIDIVVQSQITGACGLANACSPEVWRRIEITENLASAMHVSADLVQEISLDELNETFERPKRTDMICQRFQTEMEIQFTPVQDCIDRCAALYSK
jgi:dTDP-4-dehydrorhamnose reductase